MPCEELLKKVSVRASCQAGEEEADADERKMNAAALLARRSESLLRRRHRPSQERVPSTTEVDPL